MPNLHKRVYSIRRPRLGRQASAATVSNDGMLQVEAIRATNEVMQNFFSEDGFDMDDIMDTMEDMGDLMEQNDEIQEIMCSSRILRCYCILPCPRYDCYRVLPCDYHHMLCCVCCDCYRILPAPAATCSPAPLPALLLPSLPATAPLCSRLSLRPASPPSQLVLPLTPF